MRSHVPVVIGFPCEHLAISTTPGMSALVALVLVEASLRRHRLTTLIARQWIVRVDCSSCGCSDGCVAGAGAGGDDVCNAC